MVRGVIPSSWLRLFVSMRKSLSRALLKDDIARSLDADFVIVRFDAVDSANESARGLPEPYSDAPSW